MLSTSDFRVGSTFDFDGKLVSVVAVEHIKMARAGAVIKAKLRNILDGGIFEQSFRSGDKYKVVRIEKSGATYLYNDGDLYHFMDDANYEQVALNGSQLDGVLPFLKDGSPVSILRYEDKVIGVELPINVELRVTETEPGVQGDRVSGARKAATLETGYVIQVPLFVEIGDTGPGFLPNVAERAFEAFYTTKDIGKGTGLGLDIARRIVVERHGGSVVIDSRPGETVLRVALPVRRTAPDTDSG